MSFFQKVKDSIYSPAFYSKIPNFSWKSSFGYFFLLSLILVLIQTAFLIQPLFIKLPGQAKDWINTSIEKFPADLQIKFQNGQAITNVQQPYFIPLSDKSVATTSADYQNLVVIDTKTSFSASKFNEYKTAIWLTKDSFFYQDRNGIKAYELSKVKDFTLDKNFIKDLAQKINPWLKWLGPALLILSFIGLYISNSLRLIQLLVIALLILLLGKLLKWNLNYKTSYKISLYAITLGLSVELLIGVTEIFTKFHGFPFMFTLITLGVVFINLNSSRKPIT